MVSLRRHNWRLMAVITTLAVLAALNVRPAKAESVSIISQRVSCSSIIVTYQVSGSFPEQSADLSAHKGTAVVGSTSAVGGGSDGQHTVSIPVSPTQAPGTSMYAS